LFDRLNASEEELASFLVLAIFVYFAVVVVLVEFGLFVVALPQLAG
jgi:hypothetical protein